MSKPAHSRDKVLEVNPLTLNTSTLEKRIAALEERVARLEQALIKTERERPWWEQIRGQFKDDPEYEEAMRLGREYRESLRPKDDNAD